VRYRSFAISFLAAIGLFLQVIPAQVAISLPQGGSYRAGALMPVHVKLDGKTPADQELTQAKRNECADPIDRKDASPLRSLSLAA